MKLFGVPFSLLLAPSASSASDAAPEWIDGEMRRLDAADFVDASMSMAVVGIAKQGSAKASKSTKGGTGGSAKSGKTGQCAIDASVNCTTVFDGCDGISPERQLGCDCDDNCARELQFKYTGLPCNPAQSASGECTDFPGAGPNPLIAAYRATDCSSGVLATGEVKQGRSIVITAPPGSLGGCLPDLICVTIISVPTGHAQPSADTITQTFRIPSKCNGSNLILLGNYGAFESIGYSCSETDTHNCIQSISYGLSVCNIGSTEETIDEWDLTIENVLAPEKEEIDLIFDIPPEDVSLAPGDCLYDTHETAVNRCEASEISVDVFANATDPSIVEGALCEDGDELKYGWSVSPTLGPTSVPTSEKSTSPTASAKSGKSGKSEKHGHPGPGYSDKSCHAKSDKGRGGSHPNARKLGLFALEFSDSYSAKSAKSGDGCAVPRGEMCDGYPYYKLDMGYGGLGDSYGGYGGHEWTHFAEIPGDAGGPQGYGPLAHCVLAPIRSRDEFDHVVLEVDRLLAAWDHGGTGGTGGSYGSAEDDEPMDDNPPPPEQPAVWLGVVKSSLDVTRDNGGQGSRRGWYNLDGTMADVCDGDMWHDDPEQPDNGYGPDGRPEIRLALKDGLLVDYPDDKKLSWAIYKCCLKTTVFPSCGGDKY